MNCNTKVVALDFIVIFIASFDRFVFSFWTQQSLGTC